MHKNTWPVFFFPIQYFEYVLLQEEEEDKKKSFTMSYKSVWAVTVG